MLVLQQPAKKFPGGLTFTNYAKATVELPVRDIPPGARSVFPVTQHLGDPAVPTVSVGESVKAGQCIARMQGGLGANIHATHAGQVSTIGPHMTRRGYAQTCIVITHSDQDNFQTFLPPLSENATPEDLRTRIAECGLVGLGGALFPTAKKLEFAAQRKIHTLIVNGVECEPFITCDHKLMREHASEVIRGSELARRAAGAKETWIAIRHDMKEAHQALSNALHESKLPHIRLAKVPNRYPQGSENQLIFALTGKHLHHPALPHDLGLVVLNVGTISAIHYAVTEGRPLIWRIITVCGDAAPNWGNYRVRIGTPVADVLRAVGVDLQARIDVIAGGPFSGYHIDNWSVPITKGTQALLVLANTQVETKSTELACIRCEACAKVCPENLLAQPLLWHVRNHDFEQAIDLGLDRCIECGCCDLVCPSHIGLTQEFRHAKNTWASLQNDAAQAKHAAERYHQHEQRLSLPDARPSAKHSEKSSLAILDHGADPREVIRAALERTRQREHQATTQTAIEKKLREESLNEHE